MHKTTALLALVLSFAAVAKANAREPHEEWLQFLKGQWTYEYSSLSGNDGVLKGEATYRLAAKGKAIIARGVEGTDKWAELIGWQPDKKRMVFLGYGGTNNGYWHAEYDELRRDRLGGKMSGIMPNGKVIKDGAVVIERDGDNKFEVHIKATVGDEEIVDVGKFTRVSEEESEKDD